MHNWCASSFTHRSSPGFFFVSLLFFFLFSFPFVVVVFYCCLKGSLVFAGFGCGSGMSAVLSSPVHYSYLMYVCVICMYGVCVWGWAWKALKERIFELCCKIKDVLLHFSLFSLPFCNLFFFFSTLTIDIVDRWAHTLFSACVIIIMH